MNEKDRIKLSSKLPVSPGMNGKEDYLNSAVLVLLMKINDEYHFLFQKRSKQIRQAGEICFSGGMYDASLDKNTQDTALRETEEEIGLKAEHITVIGALDYVIAPMGVIVEPFLAITQKTDIKEFKLNTNEVEKIFTFPLSFFKNKPPEIYKTFIKVHPSYVDEKGEKIVLFPSKELGLGEQYAKPWGRGRNTILVYRTEQGIIWGLTAKIIYDVIKKFD